ncbi:MAG: hypothetical protein IAE91_10695 [Ignavibacteriaceae bacterium]|nr:hypothetical protein [Ignavibacteriaceae bacterium]
MTNKIAFITCDSLINLTEDDQILRNYLLKSGIEPVPYDWRKTPLHSIQEKTVIFRSPWDYYNYEEEFTNWLNAGFDTKKLVLNPLEVVKNNFNKIYLFELRDKGVLQPKMSLIKKGDRLGLIEAVKLFESSEFVIKPLFSAGAFETYRLDSEKFDSGIDKFFELCDNKSLIVQEFMPVITGGEISMVFFNRKYSHSVLKIPAKNDFRVQLNHGGTFEPYFPGDSLIKTGNDILALISGSLLYARVDGIVSDNNFYLLEVELFEPMLYFEGAENSCFNFKIALDELS